MQINIAKINFRFRQTCKDLLGGGGLGLTHTKKYSNSLKNLKTVNKSMFLLFNVNVLYSYKLWKIYSIIFFNRHSSIDNPFHDFIIIQ